MVLWIIRGVFALAAIGLGLSLALNTQLQSNHRFPVFILFFLGTGAFFLVDSLFKKKRIDLITSIYFGTLVGLFLTYIAGLVLSPLFESYGEYFEQFMASRAGDDVTTPDTLRTVIVSFFGVVLCYTCVSVLWQTKDDFRFLIPYVEFTKESRGIKPYVLDTSVVIDGRIADLIETGIIDNPLVMPRFVLAELQAVADSSDKLRRARGRRGLDILNRLRNNSAVEFQIYEHELPEMEDQPVDSKLLILAKHLNGKVVTGDFNLNKVARLQNVEVINLNEIANSIKPVFLPGEAIGVRIVKVGEEPGQGIGYLEDGTMVVVEDGRGQIGNEVAITVTSMLQTNAGRMIFGRLQNHRN